MMILEGKASGKWLGPEGRALRNGVSALIRDPRELPCPIHHVRAQQEDIINEPESGPSADPKSAGMIFEPWTS